MVGTPTIIMRFTDDQMDHALTGHSLLLLCVVKPMYLLSVTVPFKPWLEIDTLRQGRLSKPCI